MSETFMLFVQHPGTNGLSDGRDGQRIAKLIDIIESAAARHNFVRRSTTRMGEATLLCLTNGGNIRAFLDNTVNSFIKSREFTDVTLTAVPSNTADITLTAKDFLRG